MTAIRSWDLSSGRPKAQGSGDRPGEIVVAAPVDPWGGATKVLTSGSVQIDVWGLDRRCALVETHFWRRSAWWAARHGSGEYDPDNLASQVPGAGLQATVKALAIVRASTGEILEIGELPDATWLNGGSAPDGIEIESGAMGVRFKWEVEITDELMGHQSYAPAWDLVATVVVKPLGRIGCGEIVEAVEQGYSLEQPTTLALFVEPGGG